MEKNELQAQKTSRKIGRNLKQIREERGVTIAELLQLIREHKDIEGLKYPNGRKTKLGHGTLSQIENGLTLVPSGLVPILCDLFNVNAAYFFNSNHHKENKNPQNLEGVEQLRLIEDEEQETPYSAPQTTAEEVITQQGLTIKIDLSVIPDEALLAEIGRRFNRGF